MIVGEYIYRQKWQVWYDRGMTLTMIVPIIMSMTSIRLMQVVVILSAALSSCGGGV